MIGDKIRNIRLAKDLSVTGIVEQSNNAISYNRLKKIENNEIIPTKKELNIIAQLLNTKSIYLAQDLPLKIDFIAFRKLSNLSKKEQNKIQAKVSSFIENRYKLSKLCNYNLISNISQFDVFNIDEVENIADNVRFNWSLGTKSITNISNILEENGIHIINIDSDRKFDGISANVKSDNNDFDISVVVSKKELQGERQRFNLAHELGHLIINNKANLNIEKLANRFAGAFLIPKDTMFKEVGIKRHSIYFDELFLHKKNFGISIQALLYRMKDLQIITEQYFSELYINISKKGWRKEEPNPLAKEKSNWLEQVLLYALSENKLLAKDLPYYIEDNNLGDFNFDFTQKISAKSVFQKLPNQYKAKIITEQANAMVDYYLNNNELVDLGVGDFYEY